NPAAIYPLDIEEGGRYREEVLAGDDLEQERPATIILPLLLRDLHRLPGVVTVEPDTPDRVAGVPGQNDVGVILARSLLAHHPPPLPLALPFAPEPHLQLLLRQPVVVSLCRRHATASRASRIAPEARPASVTMVTSASLFASS